MSKSFKNETYEFIVNAGTVGLTDLSLTITKPDGTAITPNIAMTEIGSTGDYKASFIPTTIGSHIIKLNSPTKTSIDGQKKSLKVSELSREDLGGSNFDPSNHSLKVISDKIDSINSKVSVKDVFID